MVYSTIISEVFTVCINYLIIVKRGQEQHVVVENGTERAEGGESESELDLLAEVETESDSDDQDNAESAQRSVQTGATQGSDAGMKCCTFI